MCERYHAYQIEYELCMEYNTSISQIVTRIILEATLYFFCRNICLMHNL